MDLKELKKEIKELKKEDLVTFKWKLEGIKQTVEAINEFFKNPNNARIYFGLVNYDLWKEIKKLLEIE